MRQAQLENAIAGYLAARDSPPSPSRSVPYFASHPVRAELPEAQGGLNPPEQCHHVQVFDPSPKEESTVRVASLPRGDLLIRLQSAAAARSIAEIFPALRCHSL